MLLGICGSGRKEGNTGRLIKKILESTGMENEMVWLIDIGIGYCTGCMKCAMEGECWQKDGMSELYGKLISCDGLILGSPCYYGDVSGLFKSFIDRSIALGYMGVGKESEIPMHGRKPLAGKPVALVSAVAAHGAQRALETMEMYVQFSEMKLIDKIEAATGMKDVNDIPELIEKAVSVGNKMSKALNEK
ncbi:MAG: flavodoxin family protein [Candidatus Schekmanbacteria bacterium]|nr:MAG: flavodoxin family protein [Candidatus Schekmanbacteria bacterium]